MPAFDSGENFPRIVVEVHGAGESLTRVPDRRTDRWSLPSRWRVPAFLLLLLSSPAFLVTPEPGTTGAAAAWLARALFAAASLLLAFLFLVLPTGSPPPAPTLREGEGREGEDPSLLAERNRDLLAHHRCTKRMLHARTAGTVYRELVEGIREGLGFTGAVLAYLDQEGNLVFPPAPDPAGSGFPGLTIRRHGAAGSFFLPLLDAMEPCFQPSPPAAGREEYEAVCGRGGSLVVPLLHRGWGGDAGEGDMGAVEEGEAPPFRPALLVLRPVEGGRPIGPSTPSLLLSLLNEAETALEMADMYRRLRALSVTDGLTGLLNHREFYLRLDREVDRAKRYAHHLSLLILDVDDFKRYNDRFGHPAGDEALRVLASLLRQSARGTDILARYGGEEFAIVLPESSNAGAMLMAERIRASLAEVNLSPVPGEVVHLTVSIGIYTSEAGGTAIDTIVSMADEAAYRAKAEGKNQVILRSGL